MVQGGLDCGTPLLSVEELQESGGEVGPLVGNDLVRNTNPGKQLDKTTQHSRSSNSAQGESLWKSCGVITRMYWCPPLLLTNGPSMSMPQWSGDHRQGLEVDAVRLADIASFLTGGTGFAEGLHINIHRRISKICANRFCCDPDDRGRDDYHHPI